MRWEYLSLLRALEEERSRKIQEQLQPSHLSDLKSLEKM